MTTAYRRAALSASGRPQVTDDLATPAMSQSTGRRKPSSLWCRLSGCQSASMWTATKCGARSGSRVLVRTAAGMAVNYDAAVLSVPPASTLRDKAHDAIRNGTLPTRTLDRITGGPGRGEACSTALCRAVCDSFSLNDKHRVRKDEKRARTFSRHRYEGPIEVAGT